MNRDGLDTRTKAPDVEYKSIHVDIAPRECYAAVHRLVVDSRYTDLSGKVSMLPLGAPDELRWLLTVDMTGEYYSSQPASTGAVSSEHCLKCGLTRVWGKNAVAVDVDMGPVRLLPCDCMVELASGLKLMTGKMEWTLGSRRFSC